MTIQMGENVQNHVSEKSLVSKIQKELLQLNNKRQMTQFLNGQRCDYTFLQ